MLITSTLSLWLDLMQYVSLFNRSNNSHKIRDEGDQSSDLLPSLLTAMTVPWSLTTPVPIKINLHETYSSVLGQGSNARLSLIYCYDIDVYRSSSSVSSSSSSSSFCQRTECPNDRQHWLKEYLSMFKAGTKAAKNLAYGATLHRQRKNSTCHKL